jgi:hypothetical protein
MFDSAGKTDWSVPIGRDWQPTCIAEALDLTGGQCELAAWDKTGTLILWMGTSGRTAPVSLPLPAIGSFTLAVAAGNTTIQGSLSKSQTSLLAEMAYRYQWDIYDSLALTHPFLEGNLVPTGRPLP